ncbi:MULTISPECIES: hypothetical protein [Thalassospira]|uniref:Uncharacterized protein n=2 Tax=Thalassospira TaxID=168934 RepID=A0A367W3D7_9PROT|nr:MULTISPECIES: hypothetical protein [Thalassospira]MDG4720911.1 hypothetical protein [Thalassospira sp. FZY0004]RCK34897.1 hypothetical protein TH19_14320 [Thalassospira profundimaris]
MINEFRKNLLLGNVRKNLIIDGGCVLGLLTVCFAIDDLSFSFFTERVAKILFVLVVLFRGARLVSDTLTDEFQNNMWDFIRLSRQSAFSLVWSKLLGRTITVWLGGSIALTAYAFAEAKWLDPWTIAIVITSFIAAGVITHVVTFLVQLLAIYRQQSEGYDIGKMNRLGVQIIGLLAALPILSTIYESNSLGTILDGVIWYGWYIDLPLVLLCLTVFAITWALIASAMMMRRLLAYVPVFWVWPVFLISFALVINGFETLPYSLYYIGTLFSGGVSGIHLITLGFAAIIYVLLCFEPLGPNHIQALIKQLSSRTAIDILQHLPRSIITLVGMVAVIAVSLIFTHPTQDASVKITLALLYIGRDVLLVYGLALRLCRHRKTLASTPIIITILLLYFALPFGLDQIGLNFIATLTSPIVGNDWMALLSAIGQLVMVTVFAFRQITIMRDSKVSHAQGQ